MNKSTEDVKCPECGTTVPAHSRDCIACGTAVGFPNVRAAERAAEREAVDIRLEAAVASARAGGFERELAQFGMAMSASQAVMTRDLNVLDALIDSDNILLTTYYKMVRAGARIPQDNKWDRGRTASDSTIHPNYHEEIHYCALSLDGRGLDCFGNYYITFKESLIARRSSVFEENPFLFCDRHGIAAGKAAPAGYRATWQDRDRLAKAKLYHRIKPGMTDKDFPGILITDSGDPERCDFMEVHVYGLLHRSAIERVIGPAPQSGSDRIIWRRIKRRLDGLGVKVEET